MLGVDYKVNLYVLKVMCNDVHTYRGMLFQYIVSTQTQTTSSPYSACSFLSRRKVYTCIILWIFTYIYIYEHACPRRRKSEAQCSQLTISSRDIFSITPSPTPTDKDQAFLSNIKDQATTSWTKPCMNKQYKCERVSRKHHILLIHVDHFWPIYIERENLHQMISKVSDLLV